MECTPSLVNSENSRGILEKGYSQGYEGIMDDVDVTGSFQDPVEAGSDRIPSMISENSVSENHFVVKQQEDESPKYTVLQDGSRQYKQVGNDRMNHFFRRKCKRTKFQRISFLKKMKRENCSFVPRCKCGDRYKTPPQLLHQRARRTYIYSQSTSSNKDTCIDYQDSSFLFL